MDLAKFKQVCKLYKQETAKECFEISFTGQAPSITDDKLGGQPYLPVGEKYPTDSKNCPLPLLLQVNLKNIDLENFPKEGILEIFTNTDSPCDYSIKIFKEGLEYQKEFPETKCFYFYDNEEHQTEYFVIKPTKIKLAKKICHKPFSNFDGNDILLKIVEKVYGKVFNDFDEMCDYFEEDQFWEENGIDMLKEKLKNKNRKKDFWDFQGLIYDELYIPSSCIGGYADFTQQDPREDEDLKTECLFKIDSVGNEDFIQIIDSGIIFGLISPEDLKNKNFENCLIDYDFC